MQLALVDYHCHLDLYRNHESLYSEYRGRGAQILAVTTTPRAWKRNNELAKGASNIRVGLGLHPQLIAEGHNELSLFEELLSETKYVGEVGLDASPRYYKSFDLQKQVFERVLRCCAQQGAKIISIHAVRAVRETLQMIERFCPPDRSISVFHWFTGSEAEARRATGLGCYFSINAEMLKRDTRRALVASLPLDRILTETDGPFTNMEGRPAVPADISFTVKGLASLFKCEPHTMATEIISNLHRLEARRYR